MPKIRRWFPVSHDINSDPEVWALTDKFGDRGLRAWLEILSIADRNDGLITMPYDDLVRAFSIKLSTNQNRIRLVLDWCQTRLWLVSDPILRVRNYKEYHRTRGTGKAPSEPSEPNLTFQTGPNPPKPPNRGEVGDLTFRRFWEAYPKKVGKRAAYRAWCKEAKLCTDIQDEIFAALIWQMKQPQWTKDRGQYVPNPATWLNQARWKDEQPSESLFRGELSERTQRILRRGL
jgi:hypothetical protein